MRHYHHGPCTKEDPACREYMGLPKYDKAIDFLTEFTSMWGNSFEEDTPIECADFVEWFALRYEDIKALECWSSHGDKETAVAYPHLREDCPS